MRVRNWKFHFLDPHRARGALSEDDPLTPNLALGLKMAQQLYKIWTLCPNTIKYEYHNGPKALHNRVFGLKNP